MRIPNSNQESTREMTVRRRNFPEPWRQTIPFRWGAPSFVGSGKASIRQVKLVRQLWPGSGDTKPTFGRDHEGQNGDAAVMM